MRIYIILDQYLLSQLKTYEQDYYDQKSLSVRQDGWKRTCLDEIRILSDFISLKKHLTELEFDLLGVTQDDLCYVLQKGVFNLINLEILRLDYLEDSQPINLQVQLRGMTNLKTLVLDLGLSELCKSNINLLGSQIDQLPNLECLKLILNVAKDNQKDVLSEPKVKNVKKKQLIFNCNNFKSRMPSLSLKSLIEKCQKIKDLELSLSHKINDRKNIQFLTSQLQNFKNLLSLRLSLDYNNLKCFELKAFGSNLGQIQTLITLKLDSKWNKISSTGIQELTSGLDKCVQLQNLSIDLSINNLQFQDMTVLGENLRKINTLNELNLQLKSKRYREGDIFKKKIQDLVGSAYYDISFGLDKDNSITVNINGNTHQNLTDLEIQKTNVDLQGQVKFGDFKNSQLAKSLLNSNQIRGLELQYNQKNFGAQVAEELIKALLQLPNLNSIKLCRLLTYYFLSVVISQNAVPQSQNLQKIELIFEQIYVITKKIDESGEAHYQINFIKTLNFLFQNFNRLTELSLQIKFPSYKKLESSTLENCENLKVLKLRFYEQEYFSDNVSSFCLSILKNCKNLVSLKIVTPYSNIDLDLLTDYLQHCSFLHTLKLKFGSYSFFDTESSKKILNKLLKLKELVTIKI
ncbi:hypothetical protein ABPG74_019176 [Tetrahymena malaccensis]